jgi:hypothetical protein
MWNDALDLRPSADEAHIDPLILMKLCPRHRRSDRQLEGRRIEGGT